MSSPAILGARRAGKIIEQDWNGYGLQRRETGSEIGDTILEELVNDIVPHFHEPTLDYSSSSHRKRKQKECSQSD
ncbi:hypothetical protein POTOM_060321 [Populus tomentosa]|uniref:Uncharacterized protein n=1 Tax=Populus tomentosa TaxID=118781 RepID=A0A8X7XRN7_POPTO|nr:hypothetical protein POTOM_060321 [Populus tomentosa]